MYVVISTANGNRYRGFDNMERAKSYAQNRANTYGMSFTVLCLATDQEIVCMPEAIA